jgi:hypothetical protein
MGNEAYPPLIDCFICDNSIKIYMNGLLHVCIKQSELIGLQSWIEGDSDKTYWIEYTVKDKEITTGYDSFENWHKILTLLDGNGLFQNKLKDF